VNQLLFKINLYFKDNNKNICLQKTYSLKTSIKNVSLFLFLFLKKITKKLPTED
jgi:hypothetical protein